MNRERQYPCPQADVASRPGRGWKRAALAVVAVALFLSLTGCNDLLDPLGPLDIPFEQEPTKSTDMGAVDNKPTVPGDSDFDDMDLSPL
jgi:hypothetical protein